MPSPLQLTDEDLLDDLLKVVKTVALRELRGERPEVPDDVEGEAIRAASLTMMLLVMRKRGKIKL